MFTNAINWRVTAAFIVKMYERVTAHHTLHQPEHIGAFAGSYLAHGDWNRK
jgi:hypothetical protein